MSADVAADVEKYLRILKQALDFVPTYPIIGYLLAGSCALASPWLLLTVFRSGGPSRSWLAMVLGIVLAATIARLTLLQQQNLFVWHVIGMSIAVFALQPAALHSVLAQKSFATKKDRECRVWAHKILQTSACGCMGAALAAIYLNKPAGFPGKHFMSIHSLVGLAAIGLMVANMLQAAFMQGSPFKPKLQWKSWLHRFLGTSAFVLSFAAAVLGFYNRTAVVDWAASPIKFSLPETWSTMAGWSFDLHGMKWTWVFIGSAVCILLLLLDPGFTPKPRKANK
mmetsp:Transcript_50448/g.117754  ORF Transcript_50448/g.117754 Transcript_50448/m.117754 type:complete len:282 (+) Transcript_50448:139-984(+)